MEIKVLGTGCLKCKTLEQYTRAVVDELKLEATVSKVEDIAEILNYGVLRTPALVVNGKVIISGRLPEKEELKGLLSGI